MNTKRTKISSAKTIMFTIVYDDVDSEGARQGKTSSITQVLTSMYERMYACRHICYARTNWHGLTRPLADEMGCYAGRR